jgi:predicted metalloenzyme YecM
MQLESIIGDYQTFLQTIFEKIEAAGFDMADFSQADHMCYRVTSLEQYEQKKQAMAKVGTLLGENIINGRPIADYLQHTPVLYGKWRIDAIEIPAPKAGKSFPEGLDHIELVMYDDQKTFLKKYNDKQFNMNAADRGINPEIGYQLDDRLSVKFHLINLAAAVYLEQKLGLTDI